MKRLLVLLCVVFFIVGCASDGPKDPLGELKGDAKDNIIFRPDFANGGTR
ncbi:MAG TPA: hypothetical protein VK395_37880 [Gemmataceae bacterium]|nr:hypothetical protein [Gemmataceae bacterium]